MEALFQAKRLFQPTTPAERIVVFLASDPNRLDVRNYFWRPHTRADEALVKAEIDYLQAGTPSCALRIVRAAARTLVHTPTGTRCTITSSSSRVRCSFPVAPTTLIEATIHQLLSEGKTQQAAALFLAQSEADQNSIYGKMLNAKDPDDLFLLAKSLPYEKREFLLVQALFLYTHAKNLQGIQLTTLNMSNTKENRDHVIKAFQILIETRVPLEDMCAVFGVDEGMHAEFGGDNVLPLFRDSVDSYLIKKHLGERNFEAAIALLVKLRTVRRRNYDALNVIRALTNQVQLEEHPELLKEDEFDRAISILKIGALGRCWTGIRVPFAIQIDHAECLLQYVTDVETKEKVLALIKSAKAYSSS